MGFFTGQLPLGYIGEGSYHYKPDRLAPLMYTANDGAEYTADQEMDTDLASTPRALWLLPGYRPDSFAKSAILHDHFFEMHHRDQDVVSFSKANQLLEEMVRSEGGTRWLAWTYRVACDLGGKSVWNRGRVGASLASAHPQAASLFLLATIHEWLELGQWEKIDHRLQVMDFTGMDMRAICTWFSMLKKPEAKAHLPSLDGARQRCIAYLSSQDNNEMGQAEIFELMYG